MAEQYRFLTVEIDLALRQVSVDGVLNEVQPKVFDLLIYLIDNRDRVVSKDDLQDAIWPDTIVTESSLSRTVMKARRAIGDDDQSVITNVHGVGYRFVAVLDGEPVSKPVTQAQGRPGWQYALTAVGLAAIAVGIYAVLENRADQAIQTQLDQLAGKVAAEDYLSAYDTIVGLRESGVSDPRMDAVWPDVADTVTITSSPAGARILATEWRDPSLPEREPQVIDLGVTPIENLTLGRATWLLDVSLHGHAPVERILSSDLSRETINADPEVVIDIALLQTDALPDGMVYVPGGEYELVNPDIPRAQHADLGDFFIDQYEVSNAEYLEFVELGGYQQGTFWPEDMQNRDGNPIALTELAQIFSDRTGMPGPRGWVERRPRTGQEDWPVANVSWYEASAYCQFRGKRLPSIFEWEKASRDGRATNFEGNVMPWGYNAPDTDSRNRANYLSQSPDSKDKYRAGISPFGAYAMAGNVSEWTANPAQEGRAVVGGSFRDPPYVFAETGMHHAAVSLPTLGFRCAMSRSAEANESAVAATLNWRLTVETPAYEPVSRGEFEEFLQFYQYDRLEAEPEIVETVETPDWTRIQLRYTGPVQSSPVTAYLWLPKNAEPPFQTFLYVPDAGVFYDYSSVFSVERTIGGNIRSGRAAFTVVTRGMIGRDTEPGYTWPAATAVRYRDNMAQRAADIQLGVDYLLSRDDIDPDKLIYAALSWGAATELTQAGIERRTSAIVLIGGGIDHRSRPTRPETDPVNFAPYLDAPTLMVHGRHDEEIQWLTRGLPLWNLLEEPKELALFDGAGHLPPAEQRTPAINRFLDEYLGPTRPKLPPPPE